MSAYSLLLVRPFAVGFSASALLLLAACSASGPEPEVQASPAPASPLVRERLAAPAAAEMRAETSQKRLATLAYAPSPIADVLPPGYRDESREQYQTYADNPVFAVAETPVSTFSIDVDTGSYANVRRFLNGGQLPPKDAVRLEELVNYFPYAYPLPQGDAPFGVSTELAVTPWNPQTRLLRIAIKASDRSVEELPPANLVFLVDVSGSMHRREGLPMVQGTLKLLVEQLRPQDRVSLVTYAGDSQVVLDSTPGSDKAKIRAAIDQLSAGGSTAGESGIQLAYQQASKYLIDGGINRILLATDGDFNVGISDFDSLKQLAADKRKTGVSLTTLGFGVDNYNERLMEQLADAGNGNYAYIDNLREARKVLVDQLASTLATVASDVKLQLEFNPSEISEYRLLGYENRALKREDFSNDKVDAGDIGAGHTVTALYEIVPAGGKGWLEPLRYQTNAQPTSKSGELAWLRIRYKAPGEASSRLLERPIARAEAKPIAAASEDLRFAAAVAAFAQQLKDGRYTGDFDLAQSIALARSAKGEDRFGLRGEFIQLAEIAQSLHTSASTPARAQQ
ncbi:vWA domain-containing protein [Ectopseudomonas alcaliphila]|uniref:Ca-activated chloride channel family protein n=1 Tax=Ectopseudomonas alcaliphila TaxID=101564 RepID=A0A1G6SVV5_9GAMM|nr:VWA domain-containing protein [Pseudomonas alcaliphila]MDX5991132.1 VWA domain-containing protein [Pseudomonas alcaliphila]SDD20357.1 Ca-activated chloride channel family protein [Pseudomonas alcaliphila]